MDGRARFGSFERVARETDLHYPLAKDGASKAKASEEGRWQLDESTTKVINKM